MLINPETLPIIQAHEPATDTDIGGACDYICLANAKGVLITVSWTYVSSHDCVLTVNEATAITPTGATAITTGAEFQIWQNTDIATSDTMVRATDALTATFAHAGTKDQIIVFYIDASILSAGFDCVALVVTGSGTNICSPIYQLVGARYQQETPLTAIA